MLEMKPVIRRFNPLSVQERDLAERIDLLWKSEA